jgi:hypothetical protein
MESFALNDIKNFLHVFYELAAKVGEFGIRLLYESTQLINRLYLTLSARLAIP